MQGDATCYLRTGYEVIGGVNGSRRGKVSEYTTLTATVSWDDGETETVDQFGHGLEVVDRGPPAYTVRDDALCDCPDCYGGSDYDECED